MKKAVKIFTSMLCAASLLLSCACGLKGSTEVLDSISIESLWETYNYMFNSDRSSLSERSKELFPTVRAVIRTGTGKNKYDVKVRISNDNEYELMVNGYAYITTEPLSENTCRCIMYNKEKKVLNTTYICRITKKHATDIIFNFDGEKTIITPDTVVFIFFSYEGINYIGGISKSNEFIFWETDENWNPLL